MEGITPAATEVYEEAAQALGQVPTPRSLATDAKSLPEDPVERQGYIGAAFLTHNLAIYRNLQEQNRNSGALQFSAYTGESFGMLAAAVAGGSLSVRDGALLAYAFTPILLGASNQRAQGESSVDFARYVPTYTTDTLPVSEPAHVVALRGQADDLTRVMQTLDQVLGTSVELHKRYSPQQHNVYVTASAIPAFVRVLRSYPEITAEELKKATTFLAHSRRMSGGRDALDRFINGHSIVFSDPHTPLISNSGAGFLLTGDQVRNAVLAMTDEVMDSQHTTELIDELQPDLVAEIGRGGKSLQLLRDNAVRAGALSISNGVQAQDLIRMATLARQLHQTVRKVDDRISGLLDAADVAVLRDLTHFASKEPAFDAYLRKTALALAFDSLRHPEKVISPTSTRFREALQYTLAHRGRVRPGELVLSARLRKRLVNDPAETGHAYLELRVLAEDGSLREEEVRPTIDTEVLVVHFERPTRARVGTQTRHAVRTALRGNPLAQRIRDALTRQMLADESVTEPVGLADTIARADAVDHLVYQTAMFRLFQEHRPGLFAHSHVFLEAPDLFGWVTSLVVGKAVAPGDAVELLTHLLQNRSTASARLRGLTDALCAKIHDSELPLLSAAGSPVLARTDLRRETLAYLNRSAGRGTRRPVQLQASATVVALAYGSQLHRVDTSPHHRTTLLVRTPDELLRHGLNSELDTIESHSLLSATRAHRAVREFAQTRNMLYSTVNSYIHPGERVAGFGAGGSESMTIFFRREGDDELLVRKVLSEALTTARWDVEGTGTMLPPFTKAKRQAEYLAALPQELDEFLPRVKNVTEREVRAIDTAGGDRINRELIYEMTFIEGVEVGEYVRRHRPPSAVVAKLYEQIMTFIHHNVHSHRRTPSPGDTLEEQYFRKIEDRLLLCRQTAPRTFSSELLDSDEIVINGQRYRNYRSLLQAFRDNPAYGQILEARFHALVIGDTNTENIKIGDLAPLQAAAQLIRTGANDDEIQDALAAITPSSIGLKFLDPRAIGFRTEGAETLDDPMYDNKPWHNSIGHYDEMHNEFFDLELSTDTPGVPSISVRFHEDNPYRQTYQVRDVTEHRQTVDRDHPAGIEDYFAQVMTSVYERDENTKAQHELDDPNWITRFVFTMGTHFTAMPPFHFASEIDGSVIDSPEVQRRPLAIYAEGIKWLNWALEMLEGTRTDFLGVPAPAVPTLVTAS
ncbi:hypothetical protein [Brevibacterium casei]|uniref:ACP S-malonyltransferase n=1 Tax=Brevibacterium casei TaxID=33889 RepID=A0A7T2TGY9_9MICO|nr:hypothetical protein [Brevibacterium casei]QPS33548.1 hypothetical protein I6G59_16730 [Brevibacterium casei]